MKMTSRGLGHSFSQAARLRLNMQDSKESERFLLPVLIRRTVLALSALFQASLKMWVSGEEIVWNIC